MVPLPDGASSHSPNNDKVMSNMEMITSLAKNDTGKKPTTVTKTEKEVNGYGSERRLDTKYYIDGSQICSSIGILLSLMEHSPQRKRGQPMREAQEVHPLPRKRAMSPFDKSKNKHLSCNHNCAKPAVCEPNRDSTFPTPSQKPALSIEKAGTN
jgi:hypothetical protein